MWLFPRQELAATGFPVLPWFGLFLRDLTFLEEGNPTFISPTTTTPENFSSTSTSSAPQEDLLVNFEKLRMKYEIFQGYLKCQEAKFSFKLDINMKAYINHQILRLQTTKLSEKGSVAE